VGVAFGIDEKKQSIGDILVSTQLKLYDLQRIGSGSIPRGDKPHASPRLTNHFMSFAHAGWKGATVRSGVILSGEKLIDNIDYRDSLLEYEPEALGGEMEGTGVYVPCHDKKVDWIVVKAICDWADGNKRKNKKARQTKAATNAAQFVVESLQSSPLRHPHRE
jgi:nucleoside phosphorylase